MDPLDEPIITPIPRIATAEVMARETEWLLEQCIARWAETGDQIMMLMSTAAIISVHGYIQADGKTTNRENMQKIFDEAMSQADRLRGIN